MSAESWEGHVYFVLPVYNEEDSLRALLEMLSIILLPSARTIVAVDDGSRDASPQILADAARRLPIHTITHAPNRGIPGVFKSALEYLRSRLKPEDIVIVMEADGTSDPTRIPLMVSRICDGDDIVIASRHVSGGAYVRFPWYRTFGSSIINFVLRLLFRMPHVTDYTIFYRAYSGRILNAAFGSSISFKAQKSFAANGELLCILAAHAPRTSEVPLRYDYGLKKGPSKMRLISTLLEYIRLAGFYTFR